MFHSEDGLFFLRHVDGSVTILKLLPSSQGESSHVEFSQTITAGSWVSAVLEMSSFGERGGDFWAWHQHHLGQNDVLSSHHQNKEGGADGAGS